MSDGLLQETNVVGVTLASGDEAEAIAAVVAETHPQATIDVLPTFVRIRSPDRLEIDLMRVAERLGRPFDAPTFLVILASYSGNINAEDERVTLSTELAV